MSGSYNLKSPHYNTWIDETYTIVPFEKYISFMLIQFSSQAKITFAWSINYVIMNFKEDIG